jgi:hypothetical protein
MTQLPGTPPESAHGTHTQTHKQIRTMDDQETYRDTRTHTHGHTHPHKGDWKICTRIFFELGLGLVL